MGFFSMNEHSNLSGDFEFPTLEGYAGTVGVRLAMVEGYQNDLALFTAAVESDLAEMAIVKENGDLAPLQEASLKGMWEAIKAFFVKLGAKVKALFTSFMAKIESYLNKDTKAYVKKYEKNLNGKDFKDMKAKYAEPTSDNYQYAGFKYPEFDMTALYGKGDYEADATSREDMLAKIYKEASGNKAENSKEFAEWYHENCFKEEDEKDNWDQSTIRALAARLSGGSAVVSGLKKSHDKINANIKKAIAEIDKEAKRVDSLWKDSKDGSGKTKDYGMKIDPNNAGEFDGKGKNASHKTDIANAQKDIQAVRQEASAFQDVVLNITNVIMKEVKWGIAQDKRIFAKAVAYKTVKEDALLDMIEECAFDEAMEDLDNDFAA